MTLLLSSTKVGFTVHNKTIIQDIDIAIKKGEITTIIGPNGAGKTTLLKLILGLEKPTSGSIWQKPGLVIGYMPQKLYLNPQLPITVQRFLRLAGASLRDIDWALARTGATKTLHSPLQNVSGGELQRVLLARTLLRKPQLLILDEPVQGVDVSGQNELYHLIKELRDELGCAVLMVSHDLHVVIASTDHVICLNQYICCYGPPDTVSNHPAYLQLFGKAETSDLAIYTHHHDHYHDSHRDIVEPDHGDDKHD